MNPEHFSGQAAGEAAYLAFCPDALPPQLTLEAGLINRLSKADRALGELAGLGRTMPNPHLLIRPFIRREAVLSSRIEGTQADIADVYAYEAGQLALPGFQHDEVDVREVVNYVRALEYGLERLATLPVSLRLIRELHGKLMEGVRGEVMTPGEFRRTQNWIGAPGVQLRGAAYVPPPVEEMTQALYAFEDYLDEGNDHPPLLRLGLIHYQFEAIHPFLDGNGRIGRLLLILLLVHWQLLPSPLLYLSAYFERHRQRYYDLLMAVSQRGDWMAWLYFFLDGVAEQARDAIQRAHQLQDLRQEWATLLERQRGTALPHHVAEFLLERPIVAAEDIRVRFAVSHQTAMRALQRLSELGIVREISGRQRNQQFMAARIFEVIE